VSKESYRTDEAGKVGKGKIMWAINGNRILQYFKYFSCFTLSPVYSIHMTLLTDLYTIWTKGGTDWHWVQTLK
jgi:hypothetical protein